MTGKAIIIRGDAANLPLPDCSVDLIVTSPPYFGLRSYRDNGEHYEGQVGSEATPQEFLQALWGCMQEWWRVLKPEGSCFVNLGDKRAGSGGHNNNGLGKSTLNGHGGAGTARDQGVKGTSADGVKATRRNAPDRYNQASFGRTKSKMLIPHRFAIGCEDGLADPEGIGWVMRQDLIWQKLNGLPESVTDRHRDSHEYIFHFTKQDRYFAGLDELREPHSLDSGWAKQRAAGRGHVHEKAAGEVLGRATAPHGSLNALALEGRHGHPLGKLPGSVWPMEERNSLWDGPISFCPKCGRDLRAGSGQDARTAKVTDSIGSLTTTTDAPTDLSTSCLSDPSQKDSSSTTCAETKDALTQPTSTQLPQSKISDAITPSKPTASTGTSTPPKTLISVREGTRESVGCVCETELGPGGPSSVWAMASEPLLVPQWAKDKYGLGDHFAAFPTELPRKLILGFSPSGICVECGEPRRPVVARGAAVWDGRSAKTGPTPYAPDGNHGTGGSTLRQARPAEFTGYACACPTPEAATRPSVVLDPFGGTGTVAMVAKGLGRTGISNDLSADYCALARWRIEESGHGKKAEQRTWRDRQEALIL